MTDPMPVFTIKAKDRLALEAIRAYRRLCVEHGLTAQAREVGQAMHEMRSWQERNPDRLQLPDHAHIPVNANGEAATQ